MIYLIEQTFDAKIRPALASHGGSIEIVDLDNNILFIRFHGGCRGCSSSKATLQGGIEKVIFKDFPEIERIEDLTDHASGENPYLK
jgi:Fe/S biogenesis protein NfuA